MKFSSTLYNYLAQICIFMSFLSCTISTEIKLPNIIFILADDLGWADVSIHGSPQVKTPNIDLLATNGILLHNYYTSPLCTPSRGALLTGLHPIHLGLQHSVISNGQPWGLPLDVKTLPQYLKYLGYDTHLVGKWHLGFFSKEFLPTNRGFDTHFGYWTGHQDYYQRTSGESPTGFDLRQNENPINISEYEGQYMTDMITNKSVELIMRQKQRSNPLFLMVSHSAVHSALKRDPIQAPQEYIDRFSHIKNTKRRKFCAMVSTLDDSVAQIVSALKSADILNDTIIIFSTDNGGATRGAGNWSIDNSAGSNWPLRGAKYTLFEGGIRAIGFVWSPILKQSYVSHHLMHIQDWLPTIYSAAGGRTEDLGHTDGIDMWNTLLENSDDRRKSLLHNIDDIWRVWALRDGDYKLISGSLYRGEFDGWNWYTFKKNYDNNTIQYNDSVVYKILEEMNFEIKDVKPIVVKCRPIGSKKCQPMDKPCLFNIRTDPCERQNIYDEMPEIVDSMLNLLAEFNSTAVKPLNRRSDEKANPKYHNQFWSVWRTDTSHMTSANYREAINNFIS